MTPLIRKSTWHINDTTIYLYDNEEYIADLIDNLETMYQYEDIETEKELNEWIAMIDTDVDKVVGFIESTLSIEYQNIDIANYPTQHLLHKTIRMPGKSNPQPYDGEVLFEFLDRTHTPEEIRGLTPLDIGRMIKQYNVNLEEPSESDTHI